jgi:hypothetical protein
LNTQDPVYITNAIPDSDPIRPELIAIIILCIINVISFGLIGYLIFIKRKRITKVNVETPNKEDQERLNSE